MSALDEKIQRAVVIGGLSRKITALIDETGQLAAFASKGVFAPEERKRLMNALAMHDEILSELPPVTRATVGGYVPLLSVPSDEDKFVFLANRAQSLALTLLAMMEEFEPPKRSWWKRIFGLS